MSTQSVSALEMHSIEGYATLRSLCESFYNDPSNMTDHEGIPIFMIWASKIKELLDNQSERLIELVITIPPEEMVEIYRAYGVIALRHLNNSQLTIYCGNGPVYSCAMGLNYNSREKTAHLHRGCDTVDFDVWMNPAVVMKWPPNNRSAGFFGRTRYELISGENMPAIDFRWPLQPILQIVRPLLKPNGVCSGNTYTMLLVRPGLEEKAEQQLKGICDIAATCGLIAEVGPPRERRFTDTCNARDNDVSFRVESETGGVL